MDSELGLPFSRAHPETLTQIDIPRGCDLSLRIALLAESDPSLARQVYESYVGTFWSDGLIVDGFREWPDGVHRPANADSGPIIEGVGLAASGLGIAAARAVGDERREAILTAQAYEAVRNLPNLRALHDPEGVLPNDPGHFVTGFAVGDAALLFALTWEPTARPGG